MTLIFAHRGGKGTHPENTLCAFEEAILAKAEGIELDVQMTSDNDLVIIHDETVNRTTDGKGLVKDLSLKEIKALDAGSWFDSRFKHEKIPTLTEVLELIIKKDFCGVLNIEIKTDDHEYPGIEKKVLNTVGSFSLPCNVLFSSFNINTMKRLIKLDQSFEKAIILDSFKKKIIFCQETVDITGMHPSIKWVKKNKKEIQRFEKKIRPWTVNSKEDMQLCLELNLAGFFTDFPRIAKEIKDCF